MGSGSSVWAGSGQWVSIMFLVVCVMQVIASLGMAMLCIATTRPLLLVD